MMRAILIFKAHPVRRMPTLFRQLRCCTILQNISHLFGREFLPSSYTSALEYSSAEAATRVDLVDVVVEVDVSGAEVTTEHRGVSGEDGRNADVTRATHDQSHAGDPLVEMCHQVRRAFHLLLVLSDKRAHRQTDLDPHTQGGT